MKIDKSYPSNLSSAPSSATTAAARNNIPKPAIPAGAEVTLSTTAASMVRSNEPMPVNQGKVQEIKEAIAQGKFKINPDAIANGLLDTAREMLALQRKA